MDRKKKVSLIRFAKISPTEFAATPAQSYPGDAGFDLVVSRPVMIAAGAFGQVPTNLSLELPKGVWALLLPRSSTFLRRSLLINPGVIDEGYRDEVVGLAYNLGDKAAMLYEGDRVLQLILMGNVSQSYLWSMVQSEDIKASERRGGLGSTGPGAAGRGGFDDKV